MDWKHWLFGPNSYLCKKFGLCMDPGRPADPEIPPEDPDPEIPPEDPDEPIEPPDPEDPPAEFTKTRVPISKIKKMIGYVKADLHQGVLPFRGSKFNKKSWDRSTEHLANNDINAGRFFLTCMEDAWQKKNTICIFKKTGDKYDHYELDEDAVEALEWRLNSYWKREISTVICVGYIPHSKKGWNNNHWNGKNNINGTTTNKHHFLKDAATIAVFDNVLRILVDRWKDNPFVIFELINEPLGYAPRTLVKWYSGRIRKLHKWGISFERIMFEYFDSGKIHDLMMIFATLWGELDEPDYQNTPWLAVHTVNELEWFKRFHLPGCEMQKHFFNVYPRVVADSDGASKWQYPRFIGKGIKGRYWSVLFRRPGAWHMKKGLKYSIPRGGAGWIIMSGAAYVDQESMNKPDLERWEEIAVKGLLKPDLDRYTGLYYAQAQNARNLTDVEKRIYPPVFPEANQRPTGEDRFGPIGELKAIRNAVRELGLGD